LFLLPNMRYNPTNVQKTINLHYTNLPQRIYLPNQ
jgi:hypothetical protein